MIPVSHAERMAYLQRERWRNSKRRCQAYLRARELCLDCGDTRDSGYLRCEPCLERRRGYRRAAAKRRRTR